MRPDISVAIAATIFFGDYRREVAQLNKPTLLIQARDDVAVPPCVGEYLHNAITSSQMHRIASTGHFPHLSHPAEIIKPSPNIWPSHWDKPIRMWVCILCKSIKPVE